MVNGETQRNPKIIQLQRLLEQANSVFLKVTAQRDMGVLNIDPPLTKSSLLNLMKGYVASKDPELQTMDSGEQAFVFRYIYLESIDGLPIPLYVKAKFGFEQKSLIIFAAHPDRKW